MSLGRDLNAIDFTLQRLLDEIRADLLRLQLESERGGLHEDKHGQFVQRLEGYRQRLKRLGKSLDHAAGMTRGREQLLKQTPRGNERWNAKQSIQSHHGHRKQVEKRAAEVAVLLDQFASEGNGLTPLDLAKGLDGLGQHLQKIMDSAWQTGDTVIVQEANGFKNDFNAAAHQDGGMMPVSLWVTLITLMVGIVQARQKRKNRA